VKIRRKVLCAMNPQLYVPLIDGVMLATFFVIDPLIFVAIGYSAWKGWPSRLNRRKYGVLAIATFLPGTVLVLCGKWINADVRSWPYAAQVICFLLGLLLVGIGCGCGAGFITYRQKSA